MKLLLKIAIRIAFLSLLVFSWTRTGAIAQTPKVQLTNLDHLASKASTTVDVNIDERLIRITAKLLNDPDEAEVKKIVSGLKGIYVKSFEFDTEGQYNSSDIDAIRAQLHDPNWSRLVNVVSKKDGNVEVYVLLNGEQIGGLVVLSAEAKELTVVNIVGPVDLEKLSKLEGQFGVPNLEIETTKPKTKN